MNAREDLIEELNQLLKGTHMGAFVFQDLRDKISSLQLKEDFHEILERIKRHEVMLTRHIQILDGEPVDSSGVMGSMAEFMQMLKDLVITSDEQVVEEALKAIEMGQKAIRIFDEKHFTLSQTLQKELSIMRDDYSSIYHTLHRYLMSYK